MWIDLSSHCVECLGDNLVHLRDHVLVDIEVLVRVELVDDCLEARERKLVAVLEVTVMLAVLLDCIVRQVHKGIVNVRHVNRKLR